MGRASRAKERAPPKRSGYYLLWEEDKYLKRAKKALRRIRAAALLLLLLPPPRTYCVSTLLPNIEPCGCGYAFFSYSRCLSYARTSLRLHWRKTRWLDHAGIRTRVRKLYALAPSIVRHRFHNERWAERCPAQSFEIEFSVLRYWIALLRCF